MVIEPQTSIYKPDIYDLKYGCDGLIFVSIHLKLKQMSLFEPKIQTLRPIFINSWLLLNATY